MADNKLKFHLVSPEREVFAGEVDTVTAPGTEGEFGVLAGHAPFMTTLKEGTLTVVDGSKTKTYTVKGGFADVTAEGLTVLAETVVEA
jgi:F-type H+-transporting ATPase subunit epsilon